tara:strand:+ start:240 stop:425 length:186 start_codon:yes stop_codon:yes gene_type:complete
MRAQWLRAKAFLLQIFLAAQSCYAKFVNVLLPFLASLTQLELAIVAFFAVAQQHKHSTLSI